MAIQGVALRHKMNTIRRNLALLTEHELCLISEFQSIQRHLGLGIMAVGLRQELIFATLQIVDAVQEVERWFKLSIPDDVPLYIGGYFVTYQA